jgi:hypothetical protein
MYKKQLFNTLKPGDIFGFLDPTVYDDTKIRIYLSDGKWLTPNNKIRKFAQILPLTSVFAYVLQHESDTVSIGS